MPTPTEQLEYQEVAAATDDDLFDMVDDTETINREKTGRGDGVGGVWKIAVIDDDSDVHEVTKFALREFQIFGRRLQLLHAYSAEEGLKLIRQEPDIAVALIDVVMETQDAGLLLVQQLRGCGHDEMRLVLRTGQSGYAPELSVLRDYDINDYRTKSELTRTRLLSVLTSAIRSYRQIHTINQVRAGLKMVVEAMPDLYSKKSLPTFSRGLLSQISSLMHLPPDGIVCMATGNRESLRAEEMIVISDSGKFAGTNGKRLSDINAPRIEEVFRTLTSGKEFELEDCLALQFNAGTDALFVYIDSTIRCDDTDIELLKVFSSNAALMFENVRLIRKLDSLAFVDPYLNIPNANAMQRLIGNIPRDEGFEWLVAMFRVANTATIQSSFGTTVTHQYLGIVHERLASAFPESAMIARTADSTFAMLIEKPTFDPNQAREVVSATVEIDDLCFALDVSIGLLDVDRDASPEDVMSMANQAAIVAHRDYHGAQFRFDETVMARYRDRQRLRSEVTRAMMTMEGFEVHLQPKVDIEQGTVCGAEALARWCREGEFVSPEVFIPILEDTGRSREFLDWMLMELGHWARIREKQGLAPLSVAVNLSMCDLHRENFANSLLLTLEAAGLNPQTVQFEITESGAMENFEHTVQELTLLEGEGYSIALDDFGTGYSSLSYLSRLPVNTLKIDRSFITPLNIANARRSIAAATINMTLSLELNIVAEGIETVEQHQVMRFLGCNFCQGYLYAKPVKMSEFLQAYNNWQIGPVLAPDQG